MKYRLLILAALCSTAIAIALYFRNSVETPERIEPAAANRELRSSAAPSEVVASAPIATPAESSSHGSEARSISEEFKRATEYSEFGSSILDRAKNGDADAQYYLYAALRYCDESYRYYFRKPNGRTRTLDEALDRISTRLPVDTFEGVRTAYERCSRVFDGGSQALGTSDSWLKLATGNEQPVALVITAEHMLTHPAQDAGRDEVVRAVEPMLIKALRNGNPEAMWRIGGIQPLLSEDDDEGMLRQWAWVLAACQRGYDCMHSPGMEFSCRFDQLCAQDKDASDFIRRNTDLDFSEIESRARAINASIDAEAWDVLKREMKN